MHKKTNLQKNIRTNIKHAYEQQKKSLSSLLKIKKNKKQIDEMDGQTDIQTDVKWMDGFINV